MMPQFSTLTHAGRWVVLAPVYTLALVLVVAYDMAKVAIDGATQPEVPSTRVAILAAVLLIEVATVVLLLRSVGVV